MATVSNPIPLRTELESPSTTPPPLTELATPTPAGLAPPPVSTFCARISVFSKLAAAAADNPPVVAPEEEGATPVVWSCVGAKLAEARDGGRVAEFGAALGTGLGEAVVLVPAREARVCTREPRTGAVDGREIAAGVGAIELLVEGVPGVAVSKDCGCIGCVCEGGVR